MLIIFQPIKWHTRYCLLQLSLILGDNYYGPGLQDLISERQLYNKTL